MRCPSLLKETPWRTLTASLLQREVNSLPRQTPLPPPPGAWLLLISSIKDFTNQGRLSRAFDAYCTLRLASPSSHLLLRPLSSILICCAAMKAEFQGKQLHAHVLSLGLLANRPLPVKLVDFYASFDLLADARAVVEGLEGECLLPWNVLVSTCVSSGFPAQALEAYRAMVGRGVKGDAFTYPSVLKACGEMKRLDFGREVHEVVERDGLLSNLFVQNALVSMYAKCGAMDIARMVFDQMNERDGVSWNALISGYASKGMWDEAVNVYESMKTQGINVNTVTCNSVAGAYLHLGNYMEAIRLVSTIGSSGSWDHVTFVVGLRACSQIGLKDIGREIHGLTIRIFSSEIETVRNALITMYSQFKDTVSAYNLFQTMELKTVVTWNCMITGYCLSDKAKEGFKLLREMVLSGFRPNCVTVITVVSLCARMASIQQGRELHCYIIKHRLEDHQVVQNSLVDMYAKSGRIREAKVVFDLLMDPDKISYTSLIAGYGMQGEGIKALDLFDEMSRLGIRPDHVTMVALLSSCSHTGLVEQGIKLFEKFVAGMYDIRPLMEHYSCMVDLFARSGHLSKAEKFLDDMPIQPIPEMWASLLAACHAHRRTKIGERAATRLLEMNPVNPGHYVLIANMYAAASCWEELAKVRILMRDMGLQKVPGCAWIDIGKGYQLFLAEDRGNYQFCEIYDVMDILALHLKDAGYVGNEFMEFDEEFE